jgi:hypothetical protein
MQERQIQCLLPTTNRAAIAHPFPICGALLLNGKLAQNGHSC